MNDKYKAQYEYKKRNKDKIREYNKQYLKRTATNIKYRYDRLKARAKKLGRKFRISFKKYEQMIKGGCFYCGVDLTNSKGGNLDRKNNNNYNYTTQNTVACCTDCNNLKNYQLTVNETKYVVKLLKRFRKKFPRKKIKSQNEIRNRNKG